MNHDLPTFSLGFIRNAFHWSVAAVFSLLTASTCFATELPLLPTNAEHIKTLPAGVARDTLLAVAEQQALDIASGKVEDKKPFIYFELLDSAKATPAQIAEFVDPALAKAPAASANALGFKPLPNTPLTAESLATLLQPLGTEYLSRLKPEAKALQNLAEQVSSGKLTPSVYGELTAKFNYAISNNIAPSKASFSQLFEAAFFIAQPNHYTNAPINTKKYDFALSHIATAQTRYDLLTGHKSNIVKLRTKEITWLLDTATPTSNALSTNASSRYLQQLMQTHYPKFVANANAPFTAKKAAAELEQEKAELAKEKAELAKEKAELAKEKAEAAQTQAELLKAEEELAKATHEWKLAKASNKAVHDLDATLKVYKNTPNTSSFQQLQTAYYEIQNLITTPGIEMSGDLRVKNRLEALRDMAKEKVPELAKGKK